MTIDTSKTKRGTTLDDDDTEDARRDVLRDGQRRRFSLMMMDSDPTGLGLTPVQKQALCDGINQGVGFDRALELALATTTSNDIRLHRPGFHADAAPEAVAAAAASYDKRNARLSTAWRDSRPDVVNDRLPPITKPAQQASAFTSDEAGKAFDRRNARLANAYKG